MSTLDLFQPGTPGAIEQLGAQARQMAGVLDALAPGSLHEAEATVDGELVRLSHLIEGLPASADSTASEQAAQYMPCTSNTDSQAGRPWTSQSWVKSCCSTGSSSTAKSSSTCKGPRCSQSSADEA